MDPPERPRMRAQSNNDALLHNIVTSVICTAACLVKDLRLRDHITLPLLQLRWLPIQAGFPFISVY